MLQSVGRIARQIWRREEGRVGWVILGIVIGAALVIFGIIKFLIPGE